MRTLAIDCATEACSVALFDDGQLLVGEWIVLGRGHAERLVPMIAQLPGKGCADRIPVSRGPGSFTGVRIGIAAARALALAWRAPCFGYPTLALIVAPGPPPRRATATCRRATMASRSSSLMRARFFSACDTAMFNRFFHAMLERGVYLAPSAFEAGFLSSAHRDAEIAATIAAAREAFAEVVA